MRPLPRTQHEVMAVLAERGRTHAYEIKRVLKDIVGHASVYAALSAAQAKGYVTAQWELPEERGPSEGGGPPRKYFELTASGRRTLAESEQLLSRSRRRPAATAETRL